MEYINRTAEITLDSVADAVLKDLLNSGRTDIFFLERRLHLTHFKNLVDKYTDPFYIHSKKKYGELWHL